MAAASMRQRKRSCLRRIAAKNFLSNISLDGTQTDTNYSFHLWKSKSKKSPPIEFTASSSPPNVNGEPRTELFKNEKALKTSPNDGTKDHETRQRAQSMSQVPKSVEIEIVDKDKNLEKTPKRLRASTYSESRERSALASRKRLMHLPSETAIRENADKTEKTSRHSSSLSGESNESSIDHEIRFISPDSRRKIKNERLLIISGRKTPFLVSSVLPYSRQVVAVRSDHHEEFAFPPTTMRSRHHSGTRSISSQEDMILLGQRITRGEEGQDVSYSDLLVPSSKRRDLRRTSSETWLIGTENHTVVEEEEESQYDPNELDDPELQSGGYRTVLTFSSYMTSVIDYVKPSTLKKELNEKFKEKFPNVHLSLTKFRSLKKELRSIGHGKCNIDLWTIAQAYVFFEKLILKLLISKQNRKLCAGACLMLSAKLNDIKGQQLSRLIDQLEDDFRLHRKEMLAYEFATLVALEFSLHIRDSDIYPHYQRLLYQS